VTWLYRLARNVGYVVPKQVDIAASLRKAIRVGRHPPGSRIPTVRELTETCGAGLPTVHRALRTLADQGFIIADGRHGTRVVEHPPHLHRFGLILPELPGPGGRYASMLFQAQADAAAAIDRPDRRVVIHHAINQYPELPAHQTLLGELAAGMLAGVVLVEQACSSAWLDVRRAGIPAMGAGEPVDGFILDQWQVIIQALEAIAASGHQRFGFICDGTDISLHYVSQLAAEAARHGLSIRPAHVHCAPVAVPGWAGRAVEACLDPAGGAPPQALIVLNDNLVDSVIAALRAAGAAMLLVQLANFPSSAASWRPLLRIGWDQREVLAGAIDELVAARTRKGQCRPVSALLHSERFNA